MSKSEPKSWRDVIPVHPAADLFPMMSPDELKALGKDIKANGLRMPLVLWAPGAQNRVALLREADGAAALVRENDGTKLQLLEGRCRLDAAELVGLKVQLDRDHGLRIKRADGSRIDGIIADAVFERRTECHGGTPVETPWVTDPFAYVLSVNAHRRHLTPEQKRDVIAKVLKAQPEKSNRQIAKQTKADHKTVGAIRDKLEGRGEIPHVSTATDTRGRKQPTRKPPRSVDEFVAAKERKAAATAAADRAEERSQQAKRIEECVQNAAHAVETEQSDIERVLPDADRLVLEILERDKVAPGYAKAVMVGIAARLEVSGYPDKPDMLRREPTIAPDALT